MKYTAIFLPFCFSVANALWTQIPTGFVGVPIVFGKVTPPLMSAGLNFYNPFATYIAVVEVRAQSDSVKDVQCTTNEGISLVFEKIEIGNQLSEENVLSTISRFGVEYDKYLVTNLVRHQVNVICAQKTFHQLAITEFDKLDDMLMQFIQDENDRQKTGLDITFVRLTKPKMPPPIEKNYLSLAEEKTRKQVIEEQKIRLAAEKESEMMVAAKDNEIRAQKQTADGQMMIQSMLAKQKEQSLHNEMIVDTAKATAEKIRLEAIGMSALFAIKGYAEVKIAEAMAQNQKIYYGEKIPSYAMMNQYTFPNKDGPIIA